MKSKRRIIGVVLAALAAALVPALAFANFPLVTMSEVFFADTGIKRTSLHLHWALLVPAIMLVIGIALTFIPRRDAATAHERPSADETDKDSERNS